MKTLGLAFLLAASACAAADALDEWQWRAPAPDHGSLFDCAIYQNGLFIAAGFGVMRTSADGIHWTNCNPGTVYEIQSLAHGNGIFVGVGTGRSYTAEQTFGVVVTSPDGVNWTRQPAPTGMLGLNGVAFGASRFVAVGPRLAGNAILSSGDGLVWTVQSQTGENEHGQPTNDWQSVTFGNGLFVTTGFNYDYPSGGHAPLMTSRDGITWAPRDANSSPYSGFDAVLYAGGKFVAIGHEVVTSLDGLTWTNVNRPFGFRNYMKGLTYGNGLFVAVGAGRIETSPDAVTWIERPSGTTNDLKSVAYGNGVFAAVGWGVMLVSTNAVDWTPLLDSGTPTGLKAIAYGNSTFVAVGDGGSMLRSPDAVQWSPCSSVTSNLLRDVTWRAGQFVSVGNRGAILTSSNGLQWTSQNSGTKADLYGVAYGNGLFVAPGAGDGVFLTSSNGRDWTAQGGGFGLIPSTLVFGNGTFVAPGDYKGVLWTSPDGAHWAPQSTGAPHTPMAVGFGNGRFVLLGNGFSQWSTDGTNWSSPGLGANPWFLPRRVTYAQDKFVCVGDYGLLVSSADGEHWTAHDSGTGTRLWGVTYGQHTVVAVGDLGTILQSTPLEVLPVQLTASGGGPGAPFQIQLQGSSDQAWRLESSENLIYWTPLAELLLTNPRAEFLDYAATNFSHRYYRAVKPCTDVDCR